MSMCKHGIGYCESCDEQEYDEGGGRYDDQIRYCLCQCGCSAAVNREYQRCPKCTEGCGPVDGGDWR